jgi:hypothetical protein
MTKPSTKIVSIAPKADGKKTLSTAQKQFNSLTKKIEKQKKRLLEWTETIPVYRQKIAQHYEPLIDALNYHKAEWVLLLDQSYDMPLFTKTDKQKLRYLICDLSEFLIAEYNKDDLKPLFNKYSDYDYDSIEQDTDSNVTEMMRDIAENLFNIDWGDDVDLSSPEKFQAQLEEKMREQAEAASLNQPRKKTKKQLEKELRQEEEYALASQSVREVYRKLVAVLHPDREPDAEERLRKTELMQRVNLAYGKKDLLKLLALQLEIEQIDSEHLTNIADSRLKHFNKILKEQLSELGQEMEQIEHMFRLSLNVPYYATLTPDYLLRFLSNDIKHVANEIDAIKDEIEIFSHAPALKAWLKSYKIPKNEGRDDFNDFFLDDLMPFGFK